MTYLKLLAREMKGSFANKWSLRAYPGARSAYYVSQYKKKKYGTQTGNNCPEIKCDVYFFKFLIYESASEEKKSKKLLKT